MNKFQVELIWNREFHWVVFKSMDDLEEAKKLADTMAESGDGARVKAVRVLEINTDKVLYRR